LVRRWECETLCPKPGPLPQTSQVAAMFVTPCVLGIGRVPSQLREAHNFLMLPDHGPEHRTSLDRPDVPGPARAAGALMSVVGISLAV
jgi:hypothetical protein